MRERWAVARYVVGAAVARTGDEMSGPALLLAGFAVTGSASAASTLLAGVTASAAVGGPVVGALLDRSERPGRLLAGALAVYAGAFALILLSLGRVPLVASVAVAVGAGLLGPVLAGGWTSQLPRVVRHSRLPRVNAYDAMTFNVASLAGPALAGLVAGAVGARGSVVVAVGLICLAVPVAWALPANPHGAANPHGPANPGGAANPGGPAVAPSGSRTSFAAELGAGVRAIGRSRSLLRATVSTVISCAGLGMLIAVSPVVGERWLGEAGHGALLLAVVAAAALVANGVLARCPRILRDHPDPVLWVSALVLAAAMALMSTGVGWLLVVAVVIAGVGEGPQLTALFAVRHREAPERLRGQIFTTGASVKITGFAAGAAIAGPLAVWSLPGALLAAAGVQLLAALSYAGFTLGTRKTTASKATRPGRSGRSGRSGKATTTESR